MTEPSQATREPAPILMPMLLSFVAGYVDSYTYLALFGLFVANVTGSFVVAGAEIVRHDFGIVAKVVAVLAFLTAGALAAATIGVVHRRQRPALALMLAVEAALLGIFAAMMVFGPPIESVSDTHGIAAGLFAAMAMGTQSVLVRLLMRGVPQTNVMTGNMTQLAIELTEVTRAWRQELRDPSPRNSRELAAARQRLGAVLSLAIGFLAGTVSGATVYATVGAAGLLLAAAIVGALALGALLLEQSASAT
jgi:uncharacterized membrane protein YoaK (UPF0700 family)